ncbi:MAG: hypothetical protein Q4P18_02250 [Methanobrevibacter sp.]|uniref:hypothetical protein n=1 Tax=Methanobrevibacter sp. TaxID=66852 RepID=UPI0026DF8744|nr:hypothetical protein [Methanobrevibacter sp.]MDO5848332.1 hypothetical protein [Methanobrevibacter sp.]
MKNEIKLALAVPIILFITRGILTVIPYLALLIIGTVATYYFYKKDKKEDKDWKRVLWAYGVNYVFLALGLGLMYLAY